MLPMKRARTHSTEELDSAAQGNVEAMKELAKRLLEEKVEENEEKAVTLLENCAVLEDADAMLMLAKCCALGRGIERNAERARVLISESAEKGNSEAEHLVKLMRECKGRTGLDLDRL